MAWFSDLLSGIRDIVSPAVEVAQAVAPVAAIAAPIAGAVISSNANQKAAETYAAAQNNATAAAVQANQQAQERFQAQQAAGADAQARLRSVSALDPNVMTASQKIRLNDANRAANARLAASGLRGAGRATAAVVNDLNNRMGATFADENQRRADAATTQLASQGASANTQLANIDRSTGQTQAAGLREIGATDAGLDLAQGRNMGVAIGAIASQIASDARERGREKRYGTTQQQA